MKKLTLILTFFLAIILFTSNSYTQSLKIGPGVGYSIVQSPDNFTKSISDSGFGFGSHLQYGGKVKIGLPLLPLTITGQLFYTPLSGDGTRSVNNVPANLEVESSLLVIGVGGEWELIPGPISPYFTLDVFYSSIGETTIKSTTAGVDEQKFEGVSRTGIGLGAGLEVKILPKVNVDVSAKYNFNSLIGKESDEENFNTLNLNVNFLFSIL